MMCLETLDLKTKKTTVGWKILHHSHEGLSPPNFPLSLNHTLEVGSWERDTKTGSITGPVYHDLFFQYPKGFHFFRKKKEAFRYYLAYLAYSLVGSHCKVLEIRCRKVVATGTQNGCEVAVAKEIFILEDK